jgi:hypothetical protein
MFTFSRTLYTILCFIAGFSFGILGKLTYESTVFKAYSWDYPPILINCYGRGFSKHRAEAGIAYWKELGEDINLYIHEPSKEFCSIDYIDGFIIIRKERQKPNTLASTSRKTSFGKIISANIYYNPGNASMRLLTEHELGHALGYSHVDEPYHIMNPLYDNMGRKFWIP